VYIKVLNKGNKQMTKTFKNQLNKMTNTELQDVSNYVMSLRISNGRNAITEGSKVWVLYRDGHKVDGVVTKVMRKKALVRMSGMIYRVHMAMLEPRKWPNK
jgi:hypothetical protein